MKRFKLTVLTALILTALFFSGVSSFVSTEAKNSASTNSYSENHKKQKSKKTLKTSKYKKYLFVYPTPNGKKSITVNKNNPEFSKKLKKKAKKSFIKLSKLDKLGRVGKGTASVCKDTMPTEERGEIGMIKPTGWNQVKYPGVIDGAGYLQQRGHILMFALTGINADKRGLFTSTAQLNQEVMLEYEMKVLTYVESTGNHVLYRVTPLFYKKDLMPYGVKMEAWSVEDKGRGLKFNVICYNTQEHIFIDYTTGKSRLLSFEPEKEGDNEKKEDAADKNVRTFIINKNTKKFHLETCDSVKDIKPNNKKTVKSTKKNLEEQGYSPCKRCIK